MQLISGKKFKPFAVIVGGQPGAGKTTWAASAPSPLFICGDEVSEFDVDRLPQVKSWDEFKAQLKWVLDSKPPHETIAIDTMDAMEKLLHKKIVDEDEKSKGSMNKAHGGYGAAYGVAEREMLEVRENLIKPIRDELNKNIIIIVHSKKTNVTDPLQTMTYETYEMNLHQKVASVWGDWVSGIFFADFVTYKVDGENSNKTFLTGQGERVLYTTKKPSHFGKNRWSLPEELPLDFKEFYDRFKAYYRDGASLPDMLQEIVSLMQNIKDEELKKKISASAEQALHEKDKKKLERIINKVRELTGG